jgi:hypothetical protein
MGEVIQFIPKHERERVRLIREARALYDGVFPTAAPVHVPRDETTAGHRISCSVAYPSNGVLS